MDENKKINETGELKIPTPPPVVPKKKHPKPMGAKRLPTKNC